MDAEPKATKPSGASPQSNAIAMRPIAQEKATSPKTIITPR